MSTLREKEDNVKSKFNSIKDNVIEKKDTYEKKFAKGKDKVAKFNDKLKELDSSMDDVQKQLGTTLDGYASDLKNKLPNPSNMFEKLATNLKDILPPSKDGKESVLRKHTRTAIHKTTDQIKPIVISHIQDLFFTGDIDTSCGADTLLKNDTFTIKPSEFDFLNVLKTDPQSGLGKILYENTVVDEKIKMNRGFYDAFSSEFTFTGLDETQLFKLNWNSAQQHYTISGLQGNGTVTVDGFIKSYFESIEMPKIADIMKNTFANIVPVGGINSTNGSYDGNLNILNRVVESIMGDCGTPAPNLNQNAVNQFNENDIDPLIFFDFDGLEGIYLDDDKFRFDKVMKFSDCNNYMMPVDQTIVEDFAFLSSTKTNITDLYDSAIAKIAKDAANKNGSIPFPQFAANLDFNSLLGLPKALLASIFSPKIFFPFVVLWKMFKSGSVSLVLSIKTLMKNMAKTLVKILKEIFNFFMTTFWILVKPEIAKILKDLVSKIMKKSKQKYVKIVKILIDLLTALIPFIGIGCCDELYDAIIALFNQLNVGFQGKIPGLLLLMADKLPGFSETRADIEIDQELRSRGINTGDQFGQPSNVKDFFSGIVSGHSKEFFANTKINIAMKPSVIPVAPLGGSGVLSPANQGVGIIQ